MAAAAGALSATLVVAALAASTNFVEAPGSPVTVGINPQGHVAADLDGDLDVDLATVNISGGDVTILKNNGAGRFHATGTSPAAGSFPSGIAAADLDGDGDQDLAVANQESDDVTILKNNGSGGFHEPASSPEPAGDIPVVPVALDIDGDGDQDLAVGNATEPVGTVTILRNNGSGNFTEPASSPEPAGNKVVSLTAAKLDGDADVDLAVANQQSFNVSILSNGGSGNFTQVASSPETAGTFPQGITAVDVNGDGDQDLAVENQGSNDVTILKNNGSANFTQPATSPEPVGMRPLAPPAAADFDNDGDQDLAVSNIDDDNVTILRNGGAGNFAEPGTSPETVLDQPETVVTDDFDGDEGSGPRGRRLGRQQGHDPPQPLRYPPFQRAQRSGSPHSVSSRSCSFSTLPPGLRGSGSARTRDVLGDLEVGDPLTDVGDRCRDVEVVAGRDDHRADLLAHHVVGHRDDRGLADAGRAGERRLDLDRVDVLAAAVDHVLGAVDDVEQPVVVDPREVAGVKPAVDESLGASPRACSSSPRRRSPRAPAARRHRSPGPARRARGRPRASRSRPSRRARPPPRGAGTRSATRSR